MSPPSALMFPVLSAEETADEVVWSQGEYVPGKQIWEAFRLKGDPPAPVGIYANQPSPYGGKAASAWSVFFKLVLALIVVAVITGLMHRREQVFSQHYSFTTQARGENSFVTPLFDIKGRTGNVEVKIDTDLSNEWAFFSLALINDETGDAWDFGKEVSYYFGRDSDGSWTEGASSGSVTVGGIPPGRYYLRVEPEMEENSGSSVFKPVAMNYSITVTRGAVGYGWFVLVFFLLLIPPIIISIRTFSFENRRWAESDYGPMVSSSSSDSGDDD